VAKDKPIVVEDVRKSEPPHAALGMEDGAATLETPDASSTGYGHRMTNEQQSAIHPR
jgi:hypothetical protein